MKTVVIVFSGHAKPKSIPAGQAFKDLFCRRGWQTLKAINQMPSARIDLVAGWGWRSLMASYWKSFPKRVLHMDSGFWGGFRGYFKLGYGARWTPLSGREFDPKRFLAHRVEIIKHPPRMADSHRSCVLVAGMSGKAAISWGLQPEDWERQAIARLQAAGVRKIIYRPKPSWKESTVLDGATFDRYTPLPTVLSSVSAIVTHHSNVAIDGLVAGVPVYAEMGPVVEAGLSAASLEEVIGARTPDFELRKKVCWELAHHQWTLDEVRTGEWLRPGEPLAEVPVLVKK